MDPGQQEIITPLSFVLISFTIAFLIYPVFINLLRRKNLVETPSGHRIHTNETPSMGGLIVVLSILLTSLFFFNLESLLELKYYFLCLLLIAIIGLRDDLIPFNAWFKIITQAVPLIIVVYLNQNFLITSFYSLFPAVSLPLFAAFIITSFTLLIIINSFNLIDGIDGLSGGIGIIITLTFAFLIMPHDRSFSYLLLTFTGSLVAFLVFNWSPAKIFLGDTGALALGFVSGTAAIYFLNINNELANPYFKASVASTMGIISVPLFDTLRIIILRLKNRRSPLKADSNHLHHQLLSIGLTHGQSSLLLILLQLTSIALVWLLRNQEEYVVIFSLGLVHLGFAWITWKKSLKTKTKESGVE